MSLRSVNIAPVRKLSFKRSLPVKEVVATPEPAIENREIEEIKTQEPEPVLATTKEEQAYSKLVAINPILAELVEALDLVSFQTEERIERVEVEEEPTPDPKLKALAGRIIEGEKSYTREELISKIAEGTKTPQKRAENGFNLMLESGAIKSINKLGLYYLGASTPF